MSNAILLAETKWRNFNPVSYKDVLHALYRCATDVQLLKWMIAVPAGLQGKKLGIVKVALGRTMLKRL